MQKLDCRILDYLNDKVRDWKDFEDISSHLELLKQQNGLLNDQLLKAKVEFCEAEQESRSNVEKLENERIQHEGHKRDIDLRISEIKNSKVHEIARQEFEPVLKELNKLNFGLAYFRVLLRYNELSNAVRDNLQNDSISAFPALSELQNFSKAIEDTNAKVEDKIPYLPSFVKSCTQDLAKQVRKTWCNNLTTLLVDTCNWPSKEACIPDSQLESFERIVRSLLDFQLSDLEEFCKRIGLQDDYNSFKTTPILYSIKSLIKPLKVRFRYNFTRKKLKDRIDKPEIMFNQALEMISNSEAFLMEYFQPIFAFYFTQTPPSVRINLCFIDALSAFITGIGKMVCEKVSVLLDIMETASSSVFSHFIDEVLSFDNSLRNDWLYDGPQDYGEWKGLAGEILEQKDLFNRWLAIEKEFALKRYEDIMNTPNSGEIDMESDQGNASKSTKAATGLLDLLEAVTDRYRRVQSFNHKLRFLIDIQIYLLDLFHARLHGALESYLALTSSIGRHVQGITPSEQASLRGMEGLERLCRIYGSAECLERAMRCWSDDEFFLELYARLHEQENNRNAERELDGSLVSRTLGIVLGRGDSTGESGEQGSGRGNSYTRGIDDDPGSVFDETWAAYTRLKKRTEDVLTEVAENLINAGLKVYVKDVNILFLAEEECSVSRPQDFSRDAVGSNEKDDEAYKDINGDGERGISDNDIEADPITLTAPGTVLMRKVGQILNFLNARLALSVTHRIIRNVIQHIDQVFYKQIVHSRTFSRESAMMVYDDFFALRRFAHRIYIERLHSGPNNKLRNHNSRIAPSKTGEALKLLTMRRDDEQRGQITLEKIEKALFAAQDYDSQAVHRLLTHDMGIQALNVGEVRQILQQRSDFLTIS